MFYCTRLRVHMAMTNNNFTFAEVRNFRKSYRKRIAVVVNIVEKKD